MNAPSSFIQANYPSDAVMEPIAGPTADTYNQQAAQRPIQGKADFYIRGGLTNTALQSLQNVQKKKALREIQKKFEELVARGESSADQFLSEVKQKYPNADEYIPPKDIFRDPETGALKTYDWFKAAYVGYEELKKKDAEVRKKQQQQELIGSAQQHATGYEDEAAKSGDPMLREKYVGSALKQPWAQQEGAFDVIKQFKEAYVSEVDIESTRLREEANKLRRIGIAQARDKQEAEDIDRKFVILDRKKEAVSKTLDPWQKEIKREEDDNQRIENEIEKINDRIYNAKDGIDALLSKSYMTADYNKDKKAALEKEKAMLESKQKKYRDAIATNLKDIDGYRGQIKKIEETEGADVLLGYQQFIDTYGNTATPTVTGVIKKAQETRQDAMPSDTIAAPQPSPTAQAQAPIQTPQVGGVKPPSPAQQGSAPKRISSQIEFDALPSGTLFIGPDGKTRRKP